MIFRWVGIPVALILFSFAPFPASAFAEEKIDKSGNVKQASDKDDDNLEGAQPKLTVTEHTATIGGKPVKYKATAGYMVFGERPFYGSL